MEMQWAHTALICCVTAGSAGAKDIKPEDFMPECFRTKKTKRTLSLGELFQELHGSPAPNGLNNGLDSTKDHVERVQDNAEQNADNESVNENVSHVNGQDYAGVLD